MQILQFTNDWMVETRFKLGFNESGSPCSPLIIENDNKKIFTYIKVINLKCLSWPWWWDLEDQCSYKQHSTSQVTLQSKVKWYLMETDKQHAWDMDALTATPHMLHSAINLLAACWSIAGFTLKLILVTGFFTVSLNAL